MDAAIIKQKAKEFGADLVGITSAEKIMNIAPFHGSRDRLNRVLNGTESVIVLGRRFLWGASRQRKWNDRSSHYAGELLISKLEEVAMELSLFLEDNGFPSLTTPAGYTRSHLADMEKEGPLSLSHAAVEAGLGTLGLNLQLLTPEFGPRVALIAIFTKAPIEADSRMKESMCLGESCGRCLLSCPGEAIGSWTLDTESCRPYSSPYGFQFVKEYGRKIIDAGTTDERFEVIKSTDTLMIWQSMLRGVGVYTGCTRCQEVCPVGADYEAHLKEIQDEIPETNDTKESAVKHMRQEALEGRRSPAFENNRRWIGE